MSMKQSHAQSACTAQRKSIFCQLILYEQLSVTSWAKYAPLLLLAQVALGGLNNCIFYGMEPN
jgi:hypothetical protein